MTVTGMPALAKQMLETTRDAATNAKAVLGYDLPRTFDDLPDGSEARMMVARGNFHATLVLKPHEPPATVALRSFAAALALREAT